MTGAEALVAALRVAGVEVAFGLPGVHNMALWPAAEAAGLRLVTVRHEQAAAYAADGHARASGRPGVALVTTGPGAANTLGAVGEAWASRSQVVVVATDVPQALRREGVVRGSLHEPADQAAMFAPVTVEQRRADTADAIADEVAMALARPDGPVFLEVPTDLLAAQTDAPVETIEAASTLEGRPSLTEHVKRAQRPLIWAGGGARDQADEVRALAAALGAPVLESFRGRGIGGEHWAGLPPHVPEAGALWDQADLLIVAGGDLDGPNTQNWAQPAPPVVVDFGPPDDRADYPAVQAGDLAIDGRREPWADVAGVRHAGRTRLAAEHPREMAFVDAVTQGVPVGTTLVLDMCIPGYWLSGLHDPGEPRRVLYPMGWGTLGFAFPASLGACLAADGPTLSVSGDGGLLFNAGELATVRAEQLPTTTLIVDDRAYGMLGMPLEGGPDFTRLAESFGLPAERTTEDGLADALRRHTAEPDPSVLVLEARYEPAPTTSPRWYRRAR